MNLYLIKYTTGDSEYEIRTILICARDRKSAVRRMLNRVDDVSRITFDTTFTRDQIIL